MIASLTVSCLKWDWPLYCLKYESPSSHNDDSGMLCHGYEILSIF